MVTGKVCRGRIAVFATGIITTEFGIIGTLWDDDRCTDVVLCLCIGLTGESSLTLTVLMEAVSARAALARFADVVIITGLLDATVLAAGAITTEFGIGRTLWSTGACVCGTGLAGFSGLEDAVTTDATAGSLIDFGTPVTVVNTVIVFRDAWAGVDSVRDTVMVCVG